MFICSAPLTIYLTLLIYAVYIMLSHFFKTFLLKYRYTILFSECVDITGMHPILIDSKWCCIRYFYTYITTICSWYNKNTHNLKIFFILNQTSKNGPYSILKKQRVPFITFRLKVAPMPINGIKFEEELNTGETLILSLDSGEGG